MKPFARSLALAGFLITSFFGPLAQAADSVAFLTDIKGEVKIDGAPRPALMSELAKGQKLALGKDAAVAVMFIASGEEVLIKGPGDFEVDKPGKAINKVGQTGQITSRKTDWKISSQALVKVSQTSSASIRMRSLNPSAGNPDTKIGALTYPVRGNIAALQPVFTWQSTGANAYDVALALASEPDKPLAAGKANGTTHKFSTRLKPDTEYVWTVNAGGTELGRGKFRTLAADAILDVEKRKPADKAAFSDRLLYAILLNDLGVTQDAQAVWAKLAGERADLPELAALGKIK
ncbi:MAG: hypothetical protein JNM76_18660 [Betaproteobacteria bacterium]|nr:hypothetical protein [Betaproteobacteria bacterium]